MIARKESVEAAAVPQETSGSPGAKAEDRQGRCPMLGVAL